MSVLQKLGMILVTTAEVFYDDNVFNKKWSPKLIFTNDLFLIPLIFDIKN